MPYPPAPWTLTGVALATPRLIDIDRARLFVPRDLDIVPVLPGKTLGMVFAAYYDSDLSYSELIVAPALVRQGGFWVSHIYVDNESSVAGGRDIWGLPKQLAHFGWHPKGVDMHQGERLLCAIDHPQPFYTLRLPLMTPSVSALGTALLAFTSHFRAGLGFSLGQLTVPDESPFAALHLSQAAPMFHLRHLHLRVDAPRTVGQMRVEDEVMSV